MEATVLPFPFGVGADVGVILSDFVDDAAIGGIEVELLGVAGLADFANPTFSLVGDAFGALALIALGFCGFTGRGYIVTSRRVRMNRDNSRSQLGRDYEKCRRRLDALRTIYNALSD